MLQRFKSYQQQEHERGIAQNYRTLSLRLVLCVSVLSIAEKVAKRERKESATKNAPRNRVALRHRLRLRVSVSMHICFSFSSTALRSALTPPYSSLYYFFFLHNICNISLDEVHCSRSPRLEQLQVGARAKLLSRLSFCLFFSFLSSLLLIFRLNLSVEVC